MKRTTVVTVAAMSILGTALCLLGEQAQQEPEKKPNPLLGTWELVSFKYGDQEAFTDFPKNLHRIKMFTETHYIWFQFETNVRQIHNGGGGSYTFVDNTLTESTDFGLGEMMQYLGKNMSSPIEWRGTPCITPAPSPPG